MFGIGSGELFLIFVVAVLVLGPEHLPRIMRTTQTIMSTFRKVSTEFQRTLNLEDVLKENDSRSTTKRQSTTTKKTKKTSSTGKTTKKKSTKSASADKTGKEPTTQKTKTVKKTTSSTKSSPEKARPSGKTDSSVKTNSSDTAQPPASSQTNPKAGSLAGSQASSQTSEHLTSPASESDVFPRPTEYITVTPETQLSYEDAGVNASPEAPATTATPATGEPSGDLLDAAPSDNPIDNVSDSHTTAEIAPQSSDATDTSTSAAKGEQQKGDA